MKKFLLSIVLLILLGTCVVEAKNTAPIMSVLEKREVQTRVFELSDEIHVMKAVVNTLQDNGFIIQSIEPELGHIHAKKEVKLKRTDKKRVALFTFLLICDSLGAAMGDPSSIINSYSHSVMLNSELSLHTVVYDSNVNIQKLGNNKIKVRFVVVEKILENADGYTTVKSSPRKVVRHYEPEIFQEFFNQVHKSVFLESNL